MCAVYGFFSSQLFLSIIIFFHSTTDSQSDMNGVFNIMSSPKIRYPGVACSVLCYMLCTEKYVAANIPDQWSPSSR